jgi:hypothetical protein
MASASALLSATAQQLGNLSQAISRPALEVDRFSGRDLHDEDCLSAGLSREAF